MKRIAFCSKFMKNECGSSVAANPLEIHNFLNAFCKVFGCILTLVPGW